MKLYTVCVFLLFLGCSYGMPWLDNLLREHLINEGNAESESIDGADIFKFKRALQDFDRNVKSLLANVNLEDAEDEISQEKRGLPCNPRHPCAEDNQLLKRLFRSLIQANGAADEESQTIETADSSDSSELELLARAVEQQLEQRVDDSQLEQFHEENERSNPVEDSYTNLQERELTGNINDEVERSIGKQIEDSVNNQINQFVGFAERSAASGNGNEDIAERSAASGNGNEDIAERSAASGNGNEDIAERSAASGNGNEDIAERSAASGNGNEDIAERSAASGNGNEDSENVDRVAKMVKRCLPWNCQWTDLMEADYAKQ